MAACAPLNSLSLLHGLHRDAPVAAKWPAVQPVTVLVPSQLLPARQVLHVVRVVFVPPLV